MKKLIFSIFFIANTISLYAAESLEISNWDLDAINASRVIYSKKMTKEGEKKNLYLSPAITNQHITFLEPVTFEPLPEQMVGELAGAPVYGTKGNYVFFTSKDGWLWKFNLQTGMPEIKIRVGLKTANSVLSGNDHFLLTGNQQPADLVFLDPEDLSVVRILPVKNRKGILSPVTVVRNAGEEQGFIVVPKNFPDIWKVSYLDPPPIGFGDGWNHDYRCLKDHMDKPLFPIKRLEIELSLTNLYIDKKNINLIGANASGEGIIFDLDLSRIVSRFEISSIVPELIWETNDATQLAIVNSNKTSIAFYSKPSHLGQWSKEADVDTGYVSAISACPQSEIIWVGGENGKIQLINKHSHTIEQTFQADKRSIRQVSCTPDGKYVLIEAGENKKNLYVYENLTQKIIRKIVQK